MERHWLSPRKILEDKCKSSRANQNRTILRCWYKIWPLREAHGAHVWFYTPAAEGPFTCEKPPTLLYYSARIFPSALARLQSLNINPRFSANHWYSNGSLLKRCFRSKQIQRFPIIFWAVNGNTESFGYVMWIATICGNDVSLFPWLVYIPVLNTRRYVIILAEPSECSR